MLQELGSTGDKTTNALSGAAQEARFAMCLWGKHVSEQERGRLVKIGLNMLHFPGLISSTFLDELFHYKFIGISLLAIGLIQEKRRPMHAVNVYETLQETAQKLRKVIDDAV